MKLVTDLKQYLILNDFPSANEAIGQTARNMLSMQQESDRKLMALRDDLAADLYDLEEEYYSSPFKQTLHFVKYNFAYFENSQKGLLILLAI